MSEPLRQERSRSHRPPGPVPPGIRFRVFVRSLLLQATWNRKGMQNLGFVYALWPVLAYLYPERQARSRAAERHLTFFNTHPYLAAAILGGTIRLEEKVANGEATTQAVETFKQALMGPFAAVGDSFYWLSLRPFVGASCVLLSPFLGLWSVILFLLLYNVPHLLLRIALFREGYRLGDAVVTKVAKMSLPILGARLRAATACAGGAVPVVAAASILEAGGEPLFGSFAPWVLVASALAFLGAVVLGKRHGALSAAWPALALGMGLAVAGALGGWG